MICKDNVEHGEKKSDFPLKMVVSTAGFEIEAMDLGH